MAESNSAMTPPGLFVSLSQTVAAMTPALCDVLIKEPSPFPSSLVVIHNNHGQGAAPKSETACFATRSRNFVIGIQAGVPPEASNEDFKTATEWAKRLDQKLGELSMGDSAKYGNFVPTKDLNLDLVYGADAAKKLRTLKDKFDPDNVFSKGWPIMKE